MRLIGKIIKNRRLKMIIKKLSETKIMKNAHNVDARNLYAKDSAMVSVITLEPGQSLIRHTTPVCCFLCIGRQGNN